MPLHRLWSIRFQVLLPSSFCPCLHSLFPPPLFLLTKIWMSTNNADSSALPLIQKAVFEWTGAPSNNGSLVNFNHKFLKLLSSFRTGAPLVGFNIMLCWSSIFLVLHWCWCFGRSFRDLKQVVVVELMLKSGCSSCLCVVIVERHCVILIIVEALSFVLLRQLWVIIVLLY